MQTKDGIQTNLRGRRCLSPQGSKEKPISTKLLKRSQVTKEISTKKGHKYQATLKKNQLLSTKQHCAQCSKRGGPGGQGRKQPVAKHRDFQRTQLVRILNEGSSEGFLGVSRKDQKRKMRHGWPDEEIEHGSALLWSRKVSCWEALEEITTSDGSAH